MVFFLKFITYEAGLNFIFSVNHLSIIRQHMKKFIYIIFMLSGILFFYQCKSSGSKTSAPEEYIPTEAQLSTAQARWPEITKDTLIAGHDLYHTRCGACHVVYQIHGRTEIQWNRSINKMAPRAKLTSQEKETLRRFVLTILTTPE